MVIIDHPLSSDMYLVHACIEAPESAVMYRGRGEIVHGIATIKLPDYCTTWTDFTINLTAIGHFNNMYVSEVRDNTFTVHGNAGTFHWTVYAKRYDIEVEPHKYNTTLCGNGPYIYLQKNK
jgi:hypothetical protein